MIITLKGANFSSNNIGTLSTWTIFTSIGSGATYEGVRTVDKGASFSALVTIADGYEIGTAGVSVMMGTTDITSSAVKTTGNEIEITIGSVTGNVTISVPTVNTSTGEEEGGDEPVTGTLSLTNYTLNVTPSGLGNYGSNNTKRLSNGSLTEANGILVKQGQTITLTGLQSGSPTLRGDYFYADIAGPNETVNGVWEHAKGCGNDGTNFFPYNVDGSSDTWSITNNFGADYYFFFAFCGPTKNETVSPSNYNITYVVK